MSIFRTLVSRTNPTKMLNTFIRGSSLCYKIPPYSHTQTQTTRYFSSWLGLNRSRDTIESWIDGMMEIDGLVEAGREADRTPDSIKSWIDGMMEAGREADKFSVPADLQGNVNDVGPHGKVLPKELSRTVVKLSCESSADGGICDVYLVGTCHVSEKSFQEVKAIIGFLKPQVVFLELCLERAGDMLPLDPKLVGLLPFPYGMDIRVAYEEAGKLGSKVVLGDRRKEIRHQQYLQKIKEALHSKEILREDKGLHREYTIEEKMIDKWSAEELDERDQYMSAALLKVARDHNSVVAIVGIGHLEGIKKYWKQPTKFQLEILGAKLKLKYREDKKIIELHECEHSYHHSDSELGVVFET